MDIIILSFRDDMDGSIEWQAVVDTLDPICQVIDSDDEPEVPRFPGCTVLDSSYGSSGDRNEFVVDYAPGKYGGTPPAGMESTVRAFLAERYGITVREFGPVQPEVPAQQSSASTRPRHA